MLHGPGRHYGGRNSDDEDDVSIPKTLGTEYVDKRLQALWGGPSPGRPRTTAKLTPPSPTPAATSGGLPPSGITNPTSGAASFPRPDEHRPRPAATFGEEFLPVASSPSLVRNHSSVVVAPQHNHSAAPPPLDAPRPLPPLRDNDRLRGRMPGPVYPRVPASGRVSEQPLTDDGRVLLIIATVAGRSLVLGYNGTSDRLLLVELRGGADGRAIRQRGSAKLQAPSASEGRLETVVAVSVGPGQTEELADGWFTHPIKPRWQLVPLPSAHLAQQVRDRQEVSRREHAHLAGGIAEELNAHFPEAAVLRTAAERRLPFVDLWFPPQQSSIAGPSGSGRDQRVPGVDCWSRPAACVSPEDTAVQLALFDSRPEPNDLERGPLGDAMLLSCFVLLAEGPSPQQPFELLRPCLASHTQQHSDIGAAVVQLVREGWWRDIVVDDYLPLAPLTPGSAVLAPAGIRTIRNPGEVWPSVLEKAYAKTAGGYSLLAGMQPHDILQDITGFPSLPLNWGQGPALLADITEWRSRGFPLLLSTPGRARGVSEARGPGDEQYERQGLLAGHGYTVLRVVQIQGTALLQMRNPWSTGWQGQWAAESPNWTPELRHLCKVPGGGEPDGTFWVAWEEAMRWFIGGAVLFALPESGELRASLTLAPRPRWVLELQVGCPLRFYVGVHVRRDPDNPVTPRLMVTLLEQRGSPGEYSRCDDTLREDGGLLAVYEFDPSPRPRILVVHTPADAEPSPYAEETSVVVSLHYVSMDGPGTGVTKGTAAFRDAAPVMAALSSAGPVSRALWLPAAYALAPTEAVIQHRSRCSQPPHPTAPTRASQVAL